MTVYSSVQLYMYFFANGTVANYLSHNLNSEDLNKCCWTPNVPAKQHQALLYVGGIHDGILTEYLGGGSVVFYFHPYLGHYGEMIQFD